MVKSIQFLFILECTFSLIKLYQNIVGDILIELFLPCIFYSKTNYAGFSCEFRPHAYSLIYTPPFIVLLPVSCQGSPTLLFHRAAFLSACLPRTALLPAPRCSHSACQIDGVHVPHDSFNGQVILSFHVILCICQAFCLYSVPSSCDALFTFFPPNTTISFKNELCLLWKALLPISQLQAENFLLLVSFLGVPVVTLHIPQL